MRRGPTTTALHHAAHAATQPTISDEHSTLGDGSEMPMTYSADSLDLLAVALRLVGLFILMIGWAIAPVLP